MGLIFPDKQRNFARATIRSLETTNSVRIKSKIGWMYDSEPRKSGKTRNNKFHVEFKPRKQGNRTKNILNGNPGLIDWTNDWQRRTSKVESF